MYKITIDKLLEITNGIDNLKKARDDYHSSRDIRGEILASYEVERAISNLNTIREYLVSEYELKGFIDDKTK